MEVNDFTYETVETLEKGLEDLMDMVIGIKHNSYLYHIKCLVAAKNILVSQYLPYKIEDRVQLTETLNLKPDSGWYRSRHFLVKGAKATIKSIDIRSDEKVFYNLLFDKESEVESNGQIRMVEGRHLFSFEEKYIEKAYED